jgi:hypothetical protein
MLCGWRPWRVPSGRGGFRVSDGYVIVAIDKPARRAMSCPTLNQDRISVTHARNAPARFTHYGDIRLTYLSETSRRVTGNYYAARVIRASAVSARHNSWC